MTVMFYNRPQSDEFLQEKKLFDLSNIIDIIQKIKGKEENITTKHDVLLSTVTIELNLAQNILMIFLSIIKH